MIWDFLNAVVTLASDAVHATLAVLPASPLYLDSGTVSALAGVSGYANWFFPVSLMVGTLAAYAGVVVVWVAVLLVKQFIEAVIP
jgi:hypothetical protein